MGSFAIVVFSQEEKIVIKSPIKRLFASIKERFEKEKLVYSVENKEFQQDKNFLIIKVTENFNADRPISKEKIDEWKVLITELYQQYNLSNCILPVKSIPDYEVPGCSYNPLTGKFLFKALLLNILEEIYTARGIKIRDLDITIIQGEDFNELKTIIQLISPFVRYITIVTDYKEKVENEIEGIYSDTGLAIRVTSDFKSGLKSCHLAICLGGIENAMQRGKINPKALVINYDENESIKIMMENTLVNGIEISIPKRLTAGIDKSVFEYFNRDEITEMLLIHGLDIEEQVERRSFCIETVNILSKELRKGGFGITGLKVRRNIIKPSEIKLYGT